MTDIIPITKGRQVNTWQEVVEKNSTHKKQACKCEHLKEVNYLWAKDPEISFFIPRTIVHESTGPTLRSEGVNIA